MPKLTRSRSKSCRYNPLSATTRQESMEMDPLQVTHRDLNQWLEVDFPNSSSTTLSTASLGSTQMDLSISKEPSQVSSMSVETTPLPLLPPPSMDMIAETTETESVAYDSDVTLEDGLFVDNSDDTNKLNRFILTFFPTNNEVKWLKPETYFPNAKDLFEIWVGQFEICPTTSRLHAHIYVESVYSRRMRFNTFHRTMRRFHERVQVKNAKRASKKQRQCAINYVMDRRKRQPDSEPFSWTCNKFICAYDKSFERKKKDREGQEVETQRTWIESKPRWWSWDQILHESSESKALLCKCSWGERYHKGRYAEDKARTIREVVILYGAGGTGKTTMAHAWDAQENEDPKERYYRRNPDDGVFWGGGRSAYKGQRIVHYEEFTGQETFSRLKEVCDIGKQGPPVNVKNGGGQLNHEIVVFTSNVHPGGWFRKMWTEDPKQFHPFWRRVSKILFFPAHRADSTLNIPDEENLPYFIDQTQEWKDFAGCYDQCKDHASIHWPLKDEVEPTAMSGTFNLKQASVEHPLLRYSRTGVDPTKY
uniref:Putative replicase-related protein n=1 Tax=Chaetoceros virus YT-2008 TaxID=1071014 RepID=G5ELP9_9VIRU|nr:putative replicase-related protein [Chaetoceros virus YT-2008]